MVSGQEEPCMSRLPTRLWSSVPTGHFGRPFALQWVLGRQTRLSSATSFVVTHGSRIEARKRVCLETKGDTIRQ